MNPHFLQSAAWQSFQEALGRKVYRQKGIDWEFMAILEPGTRLSPSRLYCPYGPTVSSIKGLKSALKALTKLATSLGVKFVRIEPLGVKFMNNSNLGLENIGNLSELLGNAEVSSAPSHI